VGDHAVSRRLAMTDSTFGLGPIGQILVPVEDVERAAGYYRDQLGLRFLYAFPHMAFFDADGVRLYLAEPEQPDFGGRATIYFRVDDIAAAVAALESRGVAFGERPHVVHRDDRHELWMCFTKDPDGNNIALMSEVPLS
jgi:predicted enzyme related to lactoylglutathione lyase